MFCQKCGRLLFPRNGEYYCCGTTYELKPQLVINNTPFCPRCGSSEIDEFEETEYVEKIEKFLASNVRIRHICRNCSLHW